MHLTFEQFANQVQLFGPVFDHTHFLNGAMAPEENELHWEWDSYFVFERNRDCIELMPLDFRDTGLIARHETNPMVEVRDNGLVALHVSPENDGSDNPETEERYFHFFSMKPTVFTS